MNKSEENKQNET
jgi:hypothetical protein